MNEITIWKGEFKTLVKNLGLYLTYLSKDELDVAHRYYSLKKREQFIISRASLRIVLSKKLGVTNDEIRFYYTSFGKPEVLLPSSKKTITTFNLSHSSDYFLIAISDNFNLGVDIEKINPRIDFLSIAKTCFTINENRQIKQLDKYRSLVGFYLCWVRKESFIKGIGLGLSLPLNKFEVSISKDIENALLATYYDPSVVNNWKITSLQSPPGYVAALATNGYYNNIKYLNL